jgi:conjugal transfer pilus assembly protein TraW
MKRPSHSPARFARLALSAWTLLSAVGMFCRPMARATDLGTLGPTYEIGEPHLLQMIEQRLREKERSASSRRIEAGGALRAAWTLSAIRTPVAGVRTTAAPRTFYVRPERTRWTSNILGAKRRAAVRGRHAQANPLERGVA